MLRKIFMSGSTYTNEDVKQILADFRVSAKIDTVKIEFVLEYRAQKKTIDRICRGKGFGMEFCVETGKSYTSKEGWISSWPYWSVTIQDPTPSNLIEAMTLLDETWGLKATRVGRVDVALDAKRKGVHKDQTVSEALLSPAARHDLLSVYLECLQLFDVTHEWRHFTGDDGTVTHYLGHKHFDFFRVYDKTKDQGKLLLPEDQVARLELSLRPMTVAELGIVTVQDFIQFDQWRRVLWLIDVTDQDGYTLQCLKGRFGDALDGLSERWARETSYKENSLAHVA
jgi:hypothetical protein